MKELLENHFQVVEIIVDKMLANPNYRQYKMYRDDLIGEGSVYLCEAATRFDPNRGIKFVTYCSPIIRGKLNNYVKRKLAKINSTECYIDLIDPNELVVEDEPDKVEEEYPNGLLKMFEPKASLQNQVYYRVIVGYDTCREVAEDLGLHVRTIENTKANVLKKLRDAGKNLNRNNYVTNREEN